ncbi:MAG: hypothetical protein F4X76_08825 [Chloroflexi bacterium]|nr:hypothetical protein [Chloroflexota bacterium]
MVSLDSLRQELVEAFEERDRLDARIAQLEDAIEALARLEGEPDDDLPSRRELARDEPPRRALVGDEPPRRALVGDEPPRRGWASEKPPRRVEPRTDLRDLLERHQEDIADQIESLESSLPFVGLKYYRDQLLPQVVGEIRQGELRSLMDLMVDSGIVDVYQVENPNNPEFPTAAIRLPLSEDADDADDPDGPDEIDDGGEMDEPDELDELDAPDDAEEFDAEPR